MKSSPKILLLAVGCACALSTSSARAQSIGNWTIGSGQGHLEYTVHNGPGNVFTFDCDEGSLRSNGIKTTNISTSIAGKYPEPKTTVKAFADGQEFDLYVGELGELGELGEIATDCHVCADVFTALWSKVRISKQLIVVFGNGLSSTYHLKGAAKVLDKKTCTTGFVSH